MGFLSGPSLGIYISPSIIKSRIPRSPQDNATLPAEAAGQNSNQLLANGFLDGAITFTKKIMGEGIVSVSANLNHLTDNGSIHKGLFLAFLIPSCGLASHVAMFFATYLLSQKS